MTEPMKRLGRKGTRHFLWLFLWLAILPPTHAQTSPSFLWAKSIGGTGNDTGTSIAVDTNGNVYVAGYFSSTNIMFGNVTLTRSGGNDAFVAKYDSLGNVLWARSSQGTGSEILNAVAVDISGNVYLTGYFTATNTSFGGVALTNFGGGDIFAVKYDTDGNVLWAKSTGGTSPDYGQSVAVDTNGNAYVTGYYYSSKAFFGGFTLTNSTGGYNDVFVAKYDTNGNVLWAKTAGGLDQDGGYVVSTDSMGNVYVTGHFESKTIAFDSITLTNIRPTYIFPFSYLSDIFTVKFDTDGNVVWAKNAGGTEDDRGFGIAADSTGNVYVSGRFVSTNCFFDNVTLTNSGSISIFLAKYDNLGNLLWAKSATGNADYSGSYNGQRLAIDAAGYVYAIGSFISTNLSFGNIVLTNSGKTNIYVAKYDSSGNVLWAKSAGGNFQDTGYGIAVDAASSIYVTGNIGSTNAFFDGITLTNSGNFDVFVAKLGIVTPQIDSIEINGGNPLLSFSTIAGLQYVVEYSPDLTPGSWTNLLNGLVSGDGFPAQVTDTNFPMSVTRYYRLKQLP